MDGTGEIVIVVRVAAEAEQELTPDDIERIAEWCLAELAGELGRMAEAEAVEDVRRRVRYRAATGPCLN
jgi:hypothetical protein